MQTKNTKRKSVQEKKISVNEKYLIPGAILVAGIFIALAVIYSGGIGANPAASGLSQALSDTQDESAAEINIQPIIAEDHIRGNAEAPVKIVEFSDLECPWCQKLHPTLKGLLEEYNGQVAWVYRHSPIVSLHPKAPTEAHASECVADIAGEDAFWKFIDRVFEISPANNGLDLELLPEIAEFSGADKDAFGECMDSGKFQDKVIAQYNDAISSGSRGGTPHSVIIGPNGELVPVIGAAAGSDFSAIIEQLLK